MRSSERSPGDRERGKDRGTAKGEKATSGFEPLSGASNVSMRDLAEALDTLRELVREIRNDNG